ncbi:MAG: hypothetical protein ACR2HG_01790 [Pyrinomonadaceae bacterium]
MKKIRCLRLLILVALLLLTNFQISAQSEKVNGQNFPVAKQNDWQKISWEKWGLAFSIPPEFKQTSERPKGDSTKPDEYFGESRNYERQNDGKATAPRLEFSIDITNWKGEKVRDEYQGKMEELTPAQLFEIDYNATKRQMESGKFPIEELSNVEIGGVKGAYILAADNLSDMKGKNPTSRIRLIWQTYRLYKGNVQRILLFVDGQREELETVKKIINSFEFSQ